MDKIKIGPLQLKYYLVCAVVVLTAVYTGNLNNDIIGTFAFLLLAGWLFSYIGARIPILGKWAGGAILLPLFAGSALVYFHVIPQSLVEQVSVFMKSGFINVFLASIIVGSILSMDRKLLLQSTIRVLPCMLGALVFVYIFAYLASVVTGKSLLDGMFMVGLPNFTGGSSGAIAVVPEIYSKVFGTEAGEYSAKLLVYMNISNVITVVFAILISKMAEKYSNLAGNGKLIKGLESSVDKAENEKVDMIPNIHRLGMGLFISSTFLIAGNLAAAVIPQLNYIAWATVIIILVKVIGLSNDEISHSTSAWQAFMVKNFLPFMITGIGIASLDLAKIVEYITVANVMIIILVNIGSIVGSLIFGKLLGFYPAEAMIVIGCNMGNLGGSGALQVLSSTDRMEMMPFAVIANRIGGAINIILISLLIFKVI